MSWFSVERGSQPIYSQVRDRIRDLVHAGALAPGTKIPSSRALAKALGVSRNSVAEAYEQLRAEGILEARGTGGTYVSRLCLDAARAARNRATPHPGRHDPDAIWERALANLPTASPAGPSNPACLARDESDLESLEVAPAFDHQSAERFRTCLNYVLTNDPQRLLGQGDAAGYVPLREWIASHMRERGVEVSADEVLIIGSFRQGLALVCSAFLGPGERVLVENPGCPGIVASLLHAGARVAGVSMTPSGMDARELRQLAGKLSPRMVITTPLSQNPTGVTMGIEARRELLACADAHNLIVVEDGFTDELCYSGHLVPPLKAEDRAGRVIYIEAMSKILFPGLRIGWIVAPAPAIRALESVRSAADSCPSLVLQAACHEFCRQGYLKGHIVRMRRLCGRRREAVQQALRRYLPSNVAYHLSEGSMSVWLTLPEGVSSTQLQKDAGAPGVSLVPGTRFFINGGGERYLRLTYYGSPERPIVRGIRILGELVGRRALKVCPPPSACDTYEVLEQAT